MKNLTWAIVPATLSLTLVGQGALAKATTEQKPNILWIVTDDQRADALECWNMATRGTTESELGYVSSPNINKLASEGVLFTNSYCNSPVSGPSRASMHTGQYPHHNGMYNFQLKHDELDVSKPVVPLILRDEGYKASAFGKIGYYIYKYSEPMDFTYPDHYEQFVSEREIERSGYADYQKTNNREDENGVYQNENWFYPDGQIVSYKRYRDMKNSSPENKEIYDRMINSQELVMRGFGVVGEIIGGVSTMPTDLTEDGRIASEVCSFMDNANNGEYNSIVGKKIVGPETNQPQFIYTGFHFPHTPVLPSKEYRDQFKDKTYNIPMFSEKEHSKMSPQVKAWQKSSSILDLSEDQKQQMVQDYYAFCAMGDELIGKTVDRFKKYCYDNDQPYLILLVCGDHGWHLGEQGSCSKISGFIKSNQTAIIAVSSDKKRFPAGKVVTDFVEYVDLAPTIYSAAGVDIEDKKYDYLDGVDLALTANNKIEAKEYVLGETQLGGGHRAYLRCDDFAFSMRTRKGNGNPSMSDMPVSNVKWPMECSPEEADLGLYDLRVDIHERNNVAYDDEYKELAQWFREKLGNIVLGDDRLEVVWDQRNVYDISSFAKGSDDKKLDIPADIIPVVGKRADSSVYKE